MLKAKYCKDVETTMRKFFESLNEKDRRRYAAIEALKLGDGGQQYISEVLGCSAFIVRKGYQELQGQVERSEQVRAPGGGKKNY